MTTQTDLVVTLRSSQQLRGHSSDASLDYWESPPNDKGNKDIDLTEEQKQYMDMISWFAQFFVWSDTSRKSPKPGNGQIMVR